MRSRTESLLERGGAGLLASVVVAVLVLDLLPAGRLLFAALAPGGTFAPERALEVVSSRGAVRATIATLETAAWSGLLALVLGTLMALMLGVTDVRGRRPASFLFVLSTMISPQVVALAFVTLAGPASPLLNSLGLAPPPGSANPFMGRGGIILVLGLHHCAARVRDRARWASRASRARSWEAAGSTARCRADHGRNGPAALRPHLVSAGPLGPSWRGACNFAYRALLGLPV
jgi:iron(III) transport system permease protein